MNDDERCRAEDRSEWRRQALLAAGVAGLWEWNHRRDTARYCSIAAELLAGDANLAWHDLAPGEAFGGVYAEDAVCLRGQMQRAVSVPDVRIRGYRLCTDQGGPRRVLCSGRTCYDGHGTPIRTMGIVIDISDLGARWDSLPVDGEDTLDSVARHGMAAYEAVEATGLKSLIQPARALLTAIGREIARGLSKRHSLH